MISSDTSEWGKVEKPLYDPLSGLTGKPDYLVEENGFYIPVEVKSSRAPGLPYDSHIYQVAAYCLLVERTYAQASSLWYFALPRQNIYHRLHPRTAAGAGRNAGCHAQAGKTRRGRSLAPGAWPLRAVRVQRYLRSAVIIQDDAPAYPACTRISITPDTNPPGLGPLACLTLPLVGLASCACNRYLPQPHPPQRKTLPARQPQTRRAVYTTIIPRTFTSLPGTQAIWENYPAPR